MGALSRILGRLDADHLPRLSADEVRDRLADYLRQVEARAHHRPSLAPARFDLDALHQRIRIRTGVLRHRFDEQPADRAYLPKGTHDDEDAATIDWWTAVRDRHPRLVVLGEPGYGKTWLLRHEAQQRAVAGAAELDRGEHPEQVRVPVWLRLDELAAALPAAAIWEQLPEALVRALRSHHRLSPGLARWLEQRIAAGGCVLLLDAWDEVADNRRTLSGVLGGWARANRDGRIILTSRLAGYTGPPLDAQDVAQVELVPFSQEETERFIDAWFASEPAAATRFRGLLEHNSAVAGMSRVPLLLTLLCALVSGPREALPARRTELYERILRRFLAREHRPLEWRPDDLAIDATLEVLGHVASAFADRGGAWVDRIPAEALMAAIRAAGDTYQERRSAGQGAHEILATLSKADGVLVPAGDPTSGRSVPYLFLHRTFHEYLVARHLSRQPTERWMQSVEAHRWFEPDWDEVIAMLAGLLPDPDPLLRTLADCPDDPFHVGLLHAGRAAAELHPEQARTERAIAIVDRLVELLQGPHPDREAAVRVLHRLIAGGNPYAIAELTARLEDPEPGIRWAAARALVGTTDPQDLAGLITQLDNLDYLSRQAVVRALAVPLALAPTTDPHAAARLIACLDDPHPGGREAAVLALAGTTDPQALAGLIPRLDDPDHWVRAAAAMALKGTGNPQALSGLIARLGDPLSWVRAGAAYALAGTTDPQALAGLIPCLADPDARVRQAAAEALALVRDPRTAQQCCAFLLDRWAQAPTGMRKLVYHVLTGLAPRAYHAAPPADRPAWRAAMAEVTRTAAC